MKLKALFLTIVLCGGGQAAEAELPMRFSAGSLESITVERDGKPFLLVLWSLDCAPCRTELMHLKEALEADRAPDVVLISTDSPDRVERISALLSEYGLNGVDSWVFGDPVPERLRHEIDPQWYGELPRAYFYNKDHSRTPYSGTISLEMLARMAGNP